MKNSEKPLLKEGDLVTVNVDEHAVVSNTYKVFKKLDSECVLSHPLAPDCYLIKRDEDLNNTFPSMLSQIEKCLFFARTHRPELGNTLAADLDALCYYFVIHKRFTSKQRYDLSNICGKIASIKLDNNLNSAISTIKQNKFLLDEYNHGLVNSIKGVMADPLSIHAKTQRYTLFSIAGFVLAQMSNA